MIDSYYKPSGKIPLKFFLYFLLIMAIAFPILSVVYIYLIYYIPFVYFNFLITVGCGLVAGVIMKHAIIAGKARGPFVVLICAIIAVFVLKYLQWCVYLPVIFSDLYEIFSFNFGERLLFSLEILISPDVVLEGIGVVNEYGAWGFYDDTAVTGVLLTIIWVIEFIVIALPAILMCKDRAKFPFSEATNAWYIESDNILESDTPGNFDEIIEYMERGSFKELVQLAQTRKTTDADFLKLTFYSPPQPASGEPHYLTIEHITMVLNKKNETERKSKTLAEYIGIEDQIAQEMLKRQIAEEEILPLR